jgi:hypothetical protein
LVERAADCLASGLALERIALLLAGADTPPVIAVRLQEIRDEMARLREQQAVLVRLLRAAGLDDAAMARWHALFDQQSPEAHQRFLRSLGLKRAEIARIRDWARGLAA